MDDRWDDDEELILVGKVVTAFILGMATIAITGVVVAWGAAALASQAVQTLRRKL